MINLDALMSQKAGDGFGDPDAEWFEPNRIARQMGRINEDVRAERDTLARMWAAVAATPAGRQVLDHLAREFVVKPSFDPAMLGGSLEQVAMHGLWRDANRHLVSTILGLAERGRSAGIVIPAQERPDDEHSRPEPDTARQPAAQSEPAGRSEPEPGGFADVQLP